MKKSSRAARNPKRYVSRKEIEDARDRLLAGKQHLGDLKIILGVIDYTLAGFDSRKLLGVKKKPGRPEIKQEDHLLIACDYWRRKRSEPVEKIVASKVAEVWNCKVGHVRTQAREYRKFVMKLAKVEGWDSVSDFVSRELRSRNWAPTVIALASPK